jgi:hypothetical protein
MTDFTGFPPIEETELPVFPRLPVAHSEPEIRRLESFDRERVVCVHEIARALEQVLTKEPVSLASVTQEFIDIAQRVLDEAGGGQRSPMKGR